MKIKKIVSIAVASALVLGMMTSVSGCGKKEKEASAQDENTIKVLYEGWVNGSVPESVDENPYKKLINDTYGVDWQLNLTTDMDNEILKRFSSTSGDKPDVIIFTDFNKLKSLYNQGFLVEDYSPYLDAMPNISDYYKEHRDEIGSIYNDEGQLMCVMYPNGGNDWNFRIRKDWVEEWNKDAGTSGNPKTVDELLDMARWVKKAKGSDYYMFTSAGENEDIGFLSNFLYMFTEYNSWYVNDKGEVSHPILDGSYEEFLDFMRTVISENLVDPDWYTQSWGNHKNNLYAGKVGIDWYTPAIANEYAEGTTTDKKSGVWTNFEMPTSETGVTRQGATWSKIGTKIAINKNCSEEKIRKILTIFNDMMYQETEDINSSLYYQLRWGIGIDNYTLEAPDKENEFEKVLNNEGEETGFYAYYATVNKEDHAKAKYGSLWDYGVPIQNLLDGVIEYGKMTKHDDSAYDYIQLFDDTREYYGRQTKVNYEDMIRPVDAKIKTNMKALEDEFTINYIQKKNTMTYDQFVEKWLATGGSQEEKSATQQLNELGYVK